MATSYVPHLRLSFGGSIGTPAAEIWTNTLRFNVIGTPPNRDLLVQAAAQAVVPISDWFKSIQASICGVAKLEWIKLNWVGADGKQRDVDTVLFELLAPVAGGYPNVNAPWYQTFAITMRTRVSRGRGHSGRIFPPVVTYDTIAGSPYAGLSSVNGMAQAFATMVRALRTAMGAVWQDEGVGVPDLAVFSAGSTTAPVRQPLMTLVTSVVVDRVPDVQHRRTNRIQRSEGDTVLIDP